MHLSVMLIKYCSVATKMLLANLMLDALAGQEYFDILGIWNCLKMLSRFSKRVIF